MDPSPLPQPQISPVLKWPVAAWLAAVLAGLVAPVFAIMVTASSHGSAPLMAVFGPILAVGLMGAGMIAAAAAGRVWVGVGFALLIGTGLIVLVQALGMATVPNLLWAGFALTIASISFAARGALFARSAPGKGWWIAIAVVAGEAAMLYLAATVPGALPDWLLAMLPAQWASTAMQTALIGTGTRAASSALLALAGTAAATLLVARLWPRRWPYLIMFSVWLGLSALVLHRPGPPLPHADFSTAARGIVG